MEIITLIVGILIGSIFVWYIAKLKFHKSETMVSHKTEPNTPHSTLRRLDEKYSNTQLEVIIKKDVNNPKYIASIKCILTELSSYICDIFPNHIGDVVLGRYAELAQYLKSLGDDSGIDSIYNVLTFSGGVELRSELEKRIDEVMGWILEGYQESLDHIFEVIPDAIEMKNKFVLSGDQMAQEAMKGTMALKQNLSPLFTELIELSRLQSQLKSQFPRIKQILGSNDEIDWGNLARNFGGGALVAINPLIGIPMLLANWFGESKKEKEQQQFVEEVLKLLSIIFTTMV